MVCLKLLPFRQYVCHILPFFFKYRKSNIVTFSKYLAKISIKQFGGWIQDSRVQKPINLKFDSIGFFEICEKYFSTL